jgi:hypothetical protein
VGLVRGSGKQNIKGATEAFTNAVAIDPKVKLDEALATPEVKDAFSKAAAAAPAGGGAAEEEAPEEGAAAVTGEGGMQCTPSVREVQTRRAIPISCKTAAPAASIELVYMSFGGGQWQSLRMTQTGGEFRAEIPCEATKIAGVLKAYIQAKDKSGKVIDNLGSKDKPIQFKIGEEVSGPAPAYPGQSAPQRCAGEEICPPNFPGCGGQKCGTRDWGVSCDSSADCKCGLLCIDGTCETAPSCETDEQCTVGQCFHGRCTVFGGEEQAPYKQHWVGLHIAQDFAAIVGRTDVCVVDKNFDINQQQKYGYACYVKGTDTPYRSDSGDGLIGQPFPGTGVKGGLAMATTRVLASYDFALHRRITIGVRAGFAFGGGKPMGKILRGAVAPNGKSGTAFLPLHLEARGVFWIRDLSKKGLRPYVGLGVGLAQVDAKIPLKVGECNNFKTSGVDPLTQPGDIGGDPTLGWSDPPYNDPAADPNGNGIPDRDEAKDIDYNHCIAPTDEAMAKTYRAELTRRTVEDSEQGEVEVDAYKKMGLTFIALTPGLVYAFTPTMGLQLNLNIMYLLPPPTDGIVLEPSLGMVFAF